MRGGLACSFGCPGTETDGSGVTFDLDCICAYDRPIRVMLLVK